MQSHTNIISITGDSLTYHNGMSFTTYDRDNDQRSNENCAEQFEGAWWYKSCYYANLNGIYLPGGSGANWYHFNNQHAGLKYIEMKMEY